MAFNDTLFWYGLIYESLGSKTRCYKIIKIKEEGTFLSLVGKSTVYQFGEQNE